MNDHRAIDRRDHLRGVADVPVEPGRLHDLHPGQGLCAPGAQAAQLISWPASTSKDGTRPDGGDARLTARSSIQGRQGGRPACMALTSDQFLWKDDQLLPEIYTGIPINFGITAFLGFLVGTAIAGQTFYNFTLENLKQFGALKAMGATNGRIVQMILLQALVVGLLGYGIGNRAWPRLFGESMVQGRRTGVLHALATPAHHGRGRRPDLHPGEPGERPGKSWCSNRRWSSGADRRPFTLDGRWWRGCLVPSQMAIGRILTLEATMSAKGPIGLDEGPPDVAVGWTGISKHFGSRRAPGRRLRTWTWDVYAGQMSMIVGPSGCGKTTLLSVIAGILNATKGLGDDLRPGGLGDERPGRGPGSGPSTSASSSSNTTSCPRSRRPRTPRSRW